MLRNLILQIIQLLASKGLQVVTLKAEVLAKVTELAEKATQIAALELSLASALASGAASAAEVQVQSDRALAAEAASATANAIALAANEANANLQIQLAASEAALVAANEAEALEDLSEAELAAMLQGVVDANPADPA